MCVLNSLTYRHGTIDTPDTQENQEVHPLALAHIIHDGLWQNRAVGLGDGHAGPRGFEATREQYVEGGERRACQPKASHSSESAIAADALMNNADQIYPPHTAIDKTSNEAILYS